MKDIIQVNQVLELLKIKYDTLRSWDKKGILKAYRTPTNRRYYTRSQINDFLNKKTASNDNVILKVSLKKETYLKLKKKTFLKKTSMSEYVSKLVENDMDNIVFSEDLDFQKDDFAKQLKSFHNTLKDLKQLPKRMSNIENILIEHLEDSKKDTNDYFSDLDINLEDLDIEKESEEESEEERKERYRKIREAAIAKLEKNDTCYEEETYPSKKKISESALEKFKEKLRNA